MIDAVSGKTCPACGGRLSAADGVGFACSECGERYEVTDMFMP